MWLLLASESHPLGRGTWTLSLLLLTWLSAGSLAQPAGFGTNETTSLPLRGTFPLNQSIAASTENLAFSNGLSSSGVSKREAPKIVVLQFGTPDSATRTGFTKVTVRDAYDPDRGYGFESTKGLEAFNRGGSEIVLPKDEYTSSVYGAYRTTSDLTCALIEGTTNNAFIVALPDGEYSVWLIASDAEWDPPLFEVWAEGQKKLDVRIPRRAFVFMEPFQARATDGRLKIEFKGPHGWILSALVIGKEGPALTDMIAEIDRDIFFLSKPELPNWKELKHGAANPPLEWTSAEQQKGYMVFPVDY